MNVVVVVVAASFKRAVSAERPNPFTSPTVILSVLSQRGEVTKQCEHYCLPKRAGKHGAEGRLQELFQVYQPRGEGDLPERDRVSDDKRPDPARGSGRNVVRLPGRVCGAGIEFHAAHLLERPGPER